MTLFARSSRARVAVCRTCEDRQARDRGAPRAVRRGVKVLVDELGLGRDLAVESAGCLMRCPLDGVTVAVGYVPERGTLGHVVVVDAGLAGADEALTPLLVEAGARARADR